MGTSSRLITHPIRRTGKRQKLIARHQPDKGFNKKKKRNRKFDSPIAIQASLRTQQILPIYRLNVLGNRQFVLKTMSSTCENQRDHMSSNNTDEYRLWQYNNRLCRPCRLRTSARQVLSSVDQETKWLITFQYEYHSCNDLRNSIHNRRGSGAGPLASWTMLSKEERNIGGSVAYW